MASTKEGQKYLGRLGIPRRDAESSPVYDPASFRIYNLVIPSGEAETQVFTVPPGASTMGMIVSDSWAAAGQLTFMAAADPEAGPNGWSMVRTSHGGLIYFPSPANKSIDLTNTGLMTFPYLKIRSYNASTHGDYDQPGSPYWPEIKIVIK